ncbi:aminotransferase class I/II-fold pyridoxal phosphate-dependent enzyme [Lacibacterium aquatile]|uniref:Aminotransferase class I/II-fold pyridoxal phosphate-dependent enzyme n=1 Tax=Lacibacterium aquatile TaxID=1168082 RepID=A0ABW5DPY5_9PROT
MSSARLSHLPTYPFRRLTALLEGLDTPAGLEVINLSIGEPQLRFPELGRQALVADMDRFNKYPPGAGEPAWKKAAGDWLTRRYGLPVGMIDPATMIVPAPGTRESLFLLGLAAVPESKAGKKPVVLMPNPFYQPYAAAAVFGGAEAIFVDAPRENGFLPDLDAIAPELFQRCAIFYLCSPSNPQGVVAERAYLRRLLTLAREHDFVLAMDECYAEIWLDQAPDGALQAALDLGGSLDNLICFHSLSKRSSAPGLRSGFVAGDPKVIANLLRVMDYGGAGMPLPIQSAAAALWADDRHVEEIRAVYRQNFALAEKHLKGRFGYFRPGGGFFLWLEVGDGEAVTKALWQQAGLKILPGGFLTRDAADGSNPGRNFIRVALVHPSDIIDTALQRMVVVLEKMSCKAGGAG